MKPDADAAIRRMRSIGVVGVVDEPELVLTRLAFDHFDHVLVVEIF